jgi:8-oxo-dGTP pyrophosphatase MutT (NUDIX family)/N-acetylglutamate synthase-like GNAT family acetyltransferase
VTPATSDLLAAVASRRPVDARERESIAAFIHEFGQLTHPFSETADNVHVTASAIIVGPRGVVLHRHKRLNMWLQPGGHIDEGETPAQAALREAAEETGLPVSFADPDAPVAHVDVHPGPRRHTHLDVRYLLHAPDQPPAPPDGESQDVAWFQWHRAVAMAEPGLEGVLRALQPGHPKLRTVRVGDAAECAHVALRWRAFVAPDVPAKHSPGEVRRWMADEVIGHTEMTVAELDGTIVGFIAVDASRDGAWIEHLVVDPAWVGRGLDDRLLAAAGKQSLQVWVFQANLESRRFYERHGFVAVEFTEGAANEERAPDVRYVLDQDSSNTESKEQ